LQFKNSGLILTYPTGSIVMSGLLKFYYKFHKYRKWGDIGTIFFKLLG
jgi:hypothetical protein